MTKKDFNDFKTQAKNEGISDNDISKAQKIMNSIPLLKELISNFSNIVSLIKDYKDGTYGEISSTTIISFIAAILYLVFHFDAIPDFIPVIGYVDDASVMALVLEKFHDEIEKYKEFKRNQI